SGAKPTATGYAFNAPQWFDTTDTANPTYGRLDTRTNNIYHGYFEGVTPNAVPTAAPVPATALAFGAMPTDKYPAPAPFVAGAVGPIETDPVTFPITAPTYTNLP